MMNDEFKKYMREQGGYRRVDGDETRNIIKTTVTNTNSGHNDFGQNVDQGNTSTTTNTVNGKTTTVVVKNGRTTHYYNGVKLASTLNHDGSFQVRHPNGRTGTSRDGQINWDTK